MFAFLDDYKSFTVVQLKPRVKHGDTYLEVEKLSWKFTTSKLHIKLNNLFNGDKLLGMYKKCTISKCRYDK